MRPLDPAVHVWTAVPAAHVVPEHLAVLDAAERGRAAGLPPHVAARYVQCRALLRAVLAARSGTGPGDVRLTSRCARCGLDHGRVVVLGTTGVHAGITRAGPLVGVALTERGPVGIDIESRAAVLAAPLADVALPARELGRLRSGWVRSGALPRRWVRAEAALKALGVGLARDPSSLEVGRLRGRARDDGVVVADLRLPRGSVGAVAVSHGFPGDPGDPDDHDAHDGRDDGAAGARARLVVRRHDGAAALAGL